MADDQPEEIGPQVHIYAPGVIVRRVDPGHCPTCNSIQNFICDFYEWHGWYQTCLNCGDTWAEGERLPRPFRRGWRKEAIAEANKKAENLFDHMDELISRIEAERGNNNEK